MRILAIEPYYGGSHKAFLDGLQKHSTHEWDIITLPAYKWKWRMRHSALTVARIIEERVAKGESWDLIFATDMLNLAELIGLLPASVASLPRIFYFHENQLVYPDKFKSERDLHFGFTNFTSALAADNIWFNTAWHRQAFTDELRVLLTRMPDYNHLDEVDTLLDRSTVIGQGIEEPLAKEKTKSKILKIIWAARWEDDKNPGDLYGALKLLHEQEIDFKLSLIGESFKQYPKVIDLIKNEFPDNIIRWGFQESRTDYSNALQEANVFVSTALHEFFGVSTVEAASAGTVPLLPNRLAYPEIVRGHEDFLYENTARALSERLIEFSKIINTDKWEQLQQDARRISLPYLWNNLITKIDSQITKVGNNHEDR